MNFIFETILLLSRIVSLYSFLCLISIFLTWAPRAQYSPIVKFINQLTLPFLNLFKNIPLLRHRMIDFSPMVALGVLYLISTTLKQIAITRTFSLIFIIVLLLQIFWSIFSSILTIFLLFIGIRLVFEFLGKGNSPFWYSVDQIFRPITYKVCSFFLKNRYIKYQTSLIITLITGIVIHTLISFIIARLLH